MDKNSCLKHTKTSCSCGVEQGMMGWASWQMLGRRSFRQGGKAMINVVSWILVRVSINDSRKYSNRQSVQGRIECQHSGKMFLI